MVHCLRPSRASHGKASGKGLDKAIPMLTLSLCTKAVHAALQDEALAELKEAKHALQAAVAAAAAASKPAEERAGDRSDGGRFATRRLSRLCKRSSKGGSLEGTCMQHCSCPTAAVLSVGCLCATSGREAACL